MVKIVDVSIVRPLRLKVLRPGQTDLSAVVFKEDIEPSATHFAAFLNGAVVSIGSLYRASRELGPPGAWQLRGMASEPSVQGRGFGAELLKACFAFVDQKGGSELWCNARLSAVNFYEKYGFRVVSKNTFDIPGIGPHHVMVKTSK